MGDGSVRPDYVPPDLRTLRFRNVLELHVRNGLTEQMMLRPSELNWGLSEVSTVRLVDDEQVLARYQALALPVHHLQCNWDGERRIDIVFSTLEVE